MKKTLSVLVAAAILCAGLAMLAACKGGNDCAHSWGAWQVVSEANCQHRGICQTCGHIRATQGVMLDPYAYVITGRGEGNEQNIVLGRTYYNYPIIGVADGAFRGEEGIISVIAQDNMKFIGAQAFADITTLETVELYAGLERIDSRAFAGLTALKTIVFHGTSAEWEKIEKAADWDADSANYLLVCLGDPDPDHGSELPPIPMT